MKTGAQGQLFASRRRRGRPKARTRAGISHVARPRLSGREPIHVTWRMRREVYNLRSARCFRALRRALWAAAVRHGARICEFSIQRDHIHLIVEAQDACALARAMQGLGIRVAKRLNAVMGRHGRVLSDRYHARVLRTPTEVRNAVHYVRENRVHHAAAEGRSLAPGYVDLYASPAHPELVAPPQTWLLAEGWRCRAPRRHDADWLDRPRGL